MTPPRESVLDGPKLINEVLQDEGFELESLRTSNRNRAFTNAALVLAEFGEMKDGTRTKPADQLHVVARIPEFVAATFALKTADLKNRPLPSENRKPHLRRLVIFNQAVGAMADADPGSSYGDIINFLVASYDELYSQVSPDVRSMVINHFKESTLGALNEIAGEQLAEYLGFKVEKPTVDEDMKGVDRWITIDGRKYGVDFKCSDTGVADSHSKNSDNFAVTTTVPKDVLKKQSRLSPANVIRYAASFKKEIERERNRFNSVV